MVQLTLPKNSTVKKGKIWPAETAANGRSRNAPRVPSLKLRSRQRRQPCGGHLYGRSSTAAVPWVLDALIKIKNEIDPTLWLSAAPAAGVCGSCAMNIQGGNTLACTKADQRCASGAVGDLSPCRTMPVVVLVPDLRQFLCPIFSIDPVPEDQDGGAPQKGNGNSRRRRTAPSWTRLYECILCACCSTSLPQLLVNSERSILGPAALLQSYRWLIQQHATRTPVSVWTG